MPDLQFIDNYSLLHRTLEKATPSTTWRRLAEDWPNEVNMMKPIGEAEASGQLFFQTGFFGRWGHPMQSGPGEHRRYKAVVHAGNDLGPEI